MSQELTVEGVDLPALEKWMDENGLGSGALSSVHQLSGGTQNILVRFDRSGKSYVLRRPPIHLRDNSNKTMQREATILKALTGSKVPHPGFIAACHDETVLGACFYLMEPVDGFNPVEGLPPLHAGDAAIRHRMGLALVDAIAQLSKVDFDAAGLGGFGRLDNWIERQVGRWSAQLDSYAKFDAWPGAGSMPQVGVIAKWLDVNRPRNFTPGIIHGDFHLANVMYRQDSGELAALVDWELSTLGDPMLDLGWLVATWPGSSPAEAANANVQPWDGFPTAQGLIDRYADQTGRDMSEFDWYAVLGCYKLGIILEGTHARACAGKAPKAIGDKLHGHALGLFDRAMTRLK
ncbi:MAG: phosphotransferase family protein [Erythrobacter sp.]